MIYHVIDNTSTHYRKICADFHSAPGGHKHFFVILVKDSGDRPAEIEVCFKRNNISDYYIASGERHKTLNIFFRTAFLFRRTDLTAQEIDLMNFLAKIRKESIIMHGIYFSALAPLMFFKYLKNVTWVCWNWNRMPPRHIFSLKMLHYLYRKWNLRQYFRIVTLMSPDAEDIGNYTGHQERVSIIPYSAAALYMNIKFEHQSAIDRYAGTTILLGNNACLLNGYCSLLDRLKADLDHVQKLCCMVPYGADEMKISEFKNHFQEQYGSKIEFWTEMCSEDDHLKKMASFDVYVCPAKIQSGLGAIYPALFMGLVVFLDGFNYQWAVQMGCHVRHIDELPDFLREPYGLTDVQKKENQQCTLNVVDSMDKWHKLFFEITQ